METILRGPPLGDGVRECRVVFWLESRQRLGIEDVQRIEDDLTVTTSNHCRNERPQRFDGESFRPVGFRLRFRFRGLCFRFLFRFSG